MSSPVTAFVRVEQARKSYRSTVALDGIDLEVRRGESLGLLGRNGAGKTTLVSVLAGVLRCDSGLVRVDGLDPCDRRAKRNIGLAPQRLAVYPQLTAAENLRFFARMYGVRGDDLDACVRSGLELSDLEVRAHDRVARFSDGMQRRLNLACAVLHRPALLLLDEPTAGVDAQSRKRLFDGIDELKSAGLTVIYSTHLTDEAARLCDRVAVIDSGRLLDLGTPDQLLERYGSPDLQALLLSLTGEGLRD